MPIKIKGLHEIRTSTKNNPFPLRKGFRIGIVATGRHVVRGRVNPNRGFESSDWSVKQHEFKKPKRAVRSQSIFGYDLYLEEKLGRYLMQVIQDLLQEIEQAMAEGIPVASGELERLQEKLAGLRPSE